MLARRHRVLILIIRVVRSKIASILNLGITRRPCAPGTSREAARASETGRPQTGLCQIAHEFTHCTSALQDAAEDVRPPYAQTSSRRVLALSCLGDDSSPELDDDIDRIRPDALGHRDPLETGLQRIQGVVEFSQDSSARIARCRFYVVHLRFLTGLGALGPCVVSPRAEGPRCRARCRVHLVPVRPEAARASDRRSVFGHFPDNLDQTLCLRHSVSHYPLIGRMGASWAGVCPSRLPALRFARGCSVRGRPYALMWSDLTSVSGRRVCHPASAHVR